MRNNKLILVITAIMAIILCGTASATDSSLAGGKNISEPLADPILGVKVNYEYSDDVIHPLILVNDSNNNPVTFNKAYDSTFGGYKLNFTSSGVVNGTIFKVMVIVPGYVTQSKKIAVHQEGTDPNFYGSSEFYMEATENYKLARKLAATSGYNVNGYFSLYNACKKGLFIDLLGFYYSEHVETYYPLNYYVDEYVTEADWNRIISGDSLNIIIDLPIRTKEDLIHIQEHSVTTNNVSSNKTTESSINEFYSSESGHTTRISTSSVNTGVNVSAATETTTNPAAGDVGDSGMTKSLPKGSNDTPWGNYAFLGIISVLVLAGVGFLFKGSLFGK